MKAQKINITVFHTDNEVEYNVSMGNLNLNQLSCNDGELHNRTVVVNGDVCTEVRPNTTFGSLFIALNHYKNGMVEANVNVKVLN